MKPLVLTDQAERDRFILALDRHVSVIAPAGVGKTHAIIERVLQLAGRADASDVLPRLVVATYSVRAAQELKLRARARLRRAPEISAAARRALEQTFFGTIHSYCVRILDRFGPCLGLPAPLHLVEDEDELWRRFLRRGEIPNTQKTAHLDVLFRYFSPQALYPLGRNLSPGWVPNLDPVPGFDLGHALIYRTEMSHHTQRAIAKRQAAIEAWRKQIQQGARWHQLPKIKTTSDPLFEEVMRDALAPLRTWLEAAALVFGRQLANAYESFRRQEGVMTYNDQVRLALELLRHPQVEREMLREGHSVLLDEAQDTDPVQFEVLRRVAGWVETNPAPGQTFSLVGDFQQSIYERAEAHVYRATHQAVCALTSGQASTFQVTFRCDEAIITWINRIFPEVFRATSGQCDFVPLQARPHAGPGRVMRWKCPHNPAMGTKVEERAFWEAEALAEVLRKAGALGLGAEKWNEVAILCPRIDWLETMAAALRRAGVPSQVYSSKETHAQQPAAAWFTALLWILAHPEDGFQVGGVLRDIFGVSDEAIALYTGGDGARLRLDRVADESGIVSEHLRRLQKIQKEISTLPLHQALAWAMEKTQLLARMQAIAPGAEMELDSLLHQAKERAAEGKSLWEIALEMRQRLTQKTGQDEELHDAVQLLTSFKAKGLEWRVVILPYLFREIGLPPKTYPRVVHRMEDEHVELFAPSEKGATDPRLRHDLERLMYVAQTRAKQTLILVDDEDLFVGARKSGPWSSADLLLFNRENKAAWDELPSADFRPPLLPPTPFLKTVAQLELFLPTAAPRLHPDALSSRDLERALRHARGILKRTTPHALAQNATGNEIALSHEAEPYAQAEREEPDGFAAAAIRYGLWWHEAMQEISGLKSRTEQETGWTRWWAQCPQPERGRSEGARWLASPLALWLLDSRRRVQAEVPFLWTAEQIVEGSIDLVVADKETGWWHVIDWKTNRPTPSGSAQIMEIYQKQIDAYVQALTALLQAQTGAEISARGSLYLTATGEWLSY